MCGASCPRGVRNQEAVREPVGIARCGVKTWRHLHTRRQGAMVQVASPDVASKRVFTAWRQGAAGGVAKCGIKIWRHVTHMASGSQVASPDVASKRGVTCPRGVRGPCSVASKRASSTCAASQDVASIRGVRRPRTAGKRPQRLFSRRAICAPPQTTSLKKRSIA